MAGFRPWFRAAAAYNLVVGGLIGLAPAQTLQLLGVTQSTVLPLWQAVGMQVVVFAPAYWWASRSPWSHRYLILIALSAKVLSLAGFVVTAGLGQLPWSFGLLILGNDVIWLPAFAAFAIVVLRRSGAAAILRGD